MEEEFDFSVKFILLGNGEVGKTCIMLRFTGQPIRFTPIHTIGIDKAERVFDYGEKQAKIVIWDTAGQEKYRSAMPRDLFHRLNGALLVYDVTRPETFTSVQNWMKIIKESAPANTAVVLVANKIDNPLVVTQEEGRALANQYGIPFILTSAHAGTNVEQAFRVLLESALMKNPALIEEATGSRVKLGRESERPEFKCCNK